MGGCSLDSNNTTELACGIVVICKTWELAACVHVALWMAASCSPFTQEVWPRQENTVGAEPYAADKYSDSDNDEEEVGPGPETIVEGPEQSVNTFLIMCEKASARVFAFEDFKLWPAEDLHHTYSEHPTLSMDARLRTHMASAGALIRFQARCLAPDSPNEPP